MDLVVDFGAADRDLARVAGGAHRIVSCGLGNDGRCDEGRNEKGEGHEGMPEHDGSSSLYTAVVCELQNAVGLLAAHLGDH